MFYIVLLLLMLINAIIIDAIIINAIIIIAIIINAIIINAIIIYNSIFNFFLLSLANFFSDFDVITNALGHKVGRNPIPVPGFYFHI